MAMITKSGLELADRIRRYVPYDGGEAWLELRENCSLIARHAVSLHRVYEAECNGHPACSSPLLSNETIARLQERHAAWCERRQAQLEARIAKLAARLPGITGVKFQGDPRGAPVHLVTANGTGVSWSTPRAIVV